MRSGNSVIKIVFLLLLLAVVVVLGLVWFDYLGILDSQVPLKLFSRVLGIQEKEELQSPYDSAFLLDEERLGKREQSIELQLEEIRLTKEDQQVSEKELVQWSEELSEREKAVSEKEKSLNEALKMYDNKRANLEQMATYWGGMAPESAVAIMLEMDSLDVVDVLRTSERISQEAGKPSLVAYWISLMPSERGAEIQRLMTREAEE